MYTTGRLASGGVYSLLNWLALTIASLMASTRGVIMTSAYENAPYFSNGLKSRVEGQIPLHRTTLRAQPSRMCTVVAATEQWLSTGASQPVKSPLRAVSGTVTLVQ
jgi:hypothetical protein